MEAEITQKIKFQQGNHILVLPKGTKLKAITYKREILRWEDDSGMLRLVPAKDSFVVICCGFYTRIQGNLIQFLERVGRVKYD